MEQRPSSKDRGSLAPPTAAPGDAFCSNCRYVLTGLTESSKCPECGRPIVEVLTRSPVGPLGRRIRYRSKATLFGLPVVDVALGANREQGEKRAVAKGIIAIGDVAIGGVAIGNVATGIVAVGGVSAGVAGIGGASAGVITALGGTAVGGFAVGGLSVGVLATGGFALGVVAQGGGAVGVYAKGGAAIGTYRISATVMDVPAVDMFDRFSLVMGTYARSSATWLGRPAFMSAGFSLLLALCVVLVAIWQVQSDRRQSQ